MHLNLLTTSVLSKYPGGITFQESKTLTGGNELVTFETGAHQASTYARNRADMFFFRVWEAGFGEDFSKPLTCRSEEANTCAP
jgi:hypothetical protein